MGRKGTGVEVRGKAIRIQFSLNGEVVRRTLRRDGLRYRRPYNTRHSYATMMLMSGMTPAFCAAQPGHSVGMVLSTCTRWLDGEHNAMEMARLD